MKLHNPQMVLIDLDGTLVDSVPDLAYCTDEMLKQMGRIPAGEAKVRTWVGNGVERLVKRALTGQMEAEPDDASYQQGLPVFMEIYKKNVSARSRLYPGVKEGLDRLKARGYALGCVTNKAALFTEPLLKDLGIYDSFGLVVSGDTTPRKKPDPMPLLHAAEYFDVAPANALMVGDSVSDVKAARNAGFQVVCVPYGYNHGNDIRDAKPDAVIESLAELVILLEQAAA